MGHCSRIGCARFDRPIRSCSPSSLWPEKRRQPLDEVGRIGVAQATNHIQEDVVLAILQLLRKALDRIAIHILFADKD